MVLSLILWMYMLALAVQYFMHPLLLSIKKNSVAKQNSTDAHTTTPSLVTSPRTPPGEKRSGEQSRISWAYSSKR